MPQQAEKKLSRKEREALRRRHEILDAAEFVFSEKGYSSTTMEEVARRAEFGVGSLYTFFKNKEDLYAAMLHRRADEFEESINSIFERRDLEPLRRLETLFLARLGLLWEYPRFFRVFFHHASGVVCDPRASLTPELQERYDRFLTAISHLVEEGMTAGQIRRGDPALVVVMIEGILRGYVANLCRTQDPVRNQEEEKALFDYFARGIALAE